MDRQKLGENLLRVRERIAEAAGRGGRRPEAVRLVAVTKTANVATIRELVGLGQCDLGENRAQALLARADALADLPDVRWHMIGHLQRNKVRHVLAHAACLHAVDSLPLAGEIEKRAAAAERTAELMIEVNVSGEAGKFGVAPEAAGDLAAAIGAMPHCRCVGLMTMAPLVEDPEAARPVFAALRRLRDAVRDGGVASCVQLSMGMSNDYEVAVEEGATVCRIGTALFA
jgi:pyridoxal phosphate enzyme (YggS family)